MMNRAGFLTRILAALGVGAVATLAGSPVMARSIKSRVVPSSPPAPPCPRCGGTGMIPVEGSAGDMSMVLGHRTGYLPDPSSVPIYMSRACPKCSWTPDEYTEKHPVYGKPFIKAEDFDKLQREINRDLARQLDRYGR